MEYPLDEVSSWIHAQPTKSFLISKEEDGDLDQVELLIEQVSFRTLKEKDVDGYLADQALLLHGDGTIHTAIKDERLPQDVYEIPLSGTWSTQSVAAGMQIKTERAVYTIQPN